MWRHMLTKFASYKVPPVMVSTLGSVVPLAMFRHVRRTRHFPEGSYQAVNNFATKYLFYCEILARQPVNGAAHTLEDFGAFEVERILRVGQTLHVVLKL